jgi:hypothetical protein
MSNQVEEKEGKSHPKLPSSIGEESRTEENEKLLIERRLKLLGEAKGFLELVNQTIKNKQEDINRDDCTITPEQTSFKWGDAIYEQRGRGLREACLGDTKDKLVIEVEHTPNNCISTLWGVGKVLETFEKYTVWFVSYNRSEKGYLSTWFCDSHDDDWNEDRHLALFVFTEEDEIRLDVDVNALSVDDLETLVNAFVGGGNKP